MLPAQVIDTPVMGAVEPRLWTPPLRDLSEPDATYGHKVIAFARDILGVPLDPWQEWVALHSGELLDDGRPRFRTVLILVARQQGKTAYAKVLALYWLFVEQQKLVLGTSTNRDYAKEAWLGAVELAEENEYLADEVAGVRRANGEETLTTADGCRYKIAASNRRGGRSLTINRLILDELREHATWEAWNASVNATNAVPDAQVVCISNQGDESSIVLDALRAPAIAYIERGEGDRRLGLFEYSAPDGAPADDIEALAMANPSLGHRTDADTLLGAARRAILAGGAELAGFKTEVLCQRVHMLDPAIDPDRWAECGVEPEQAIDLAQHRERVGLCLDVALDGSHASLVAAALIDGRVHVDVVKAWEGYGCTKLVRAELPEIVRKVSPGAFGWFPAGPAAGLLADLAERKTASNRWPPRRVVLDEIRGDVAAVCMGLAEQVVSREIQHARDPMLTQHVHSAQRMRRGDAYVFQRRDAGAIDGAYAMAGAVHLARTMKIRPPLTAM